MRWGCYRVAGGIGEDWNGRGSGKFLPLLPLGMIVLSLARASLMRWAVKTWVTCKYSNEFGEVLVPEDIALGCRSSICLQCWVIGVSQYPPISHHQLLPEIAPTAYLQVWESLSVLQLLLSWTAQIFVLQELCEAGRNPPPSPAVKVLICLSWEKPNLFMLG